MDPSVLGSVRLGSGRRLTGLGLSPEQVALDQRRRILAGAAQAFALHGYRGATVRHMIEAAGVPRGTFCELFDGKPPGLAEFSLLPYVGSEAARIAIRQALSQADGRTGSSSLHSA